MFSFVELSQNHSIVIVIPTSSKLSVFMFLFLICIKFTLLSIISAACQIDPLKLNPTPLIFDANHSIIYSNSRNRLATLEQDDNISIACPGNDLLLNGVALGEIIAATCLDGAQLGYEGRSIDFYSLKCRDFPKDTIKYTQKSCREGGEEIEIGYSIPDGTFIRQIKICFDSINFTPLFSQYNLTKDIAYRDGRVPRKYFQEDGFYSTSKSLDELYWRDNVRKTVNTLLDLDANSEKYIKQNGEFFINRGHLTPKGDFVYAFQQLSTFHYVNSAPQWASFNGGNWNELEISIREYAEYNRADLNIYTGVTGITTLENRKDNTNKQLFLHSLNGKNLIPVPRLFWKLIYDKDKESGVVVIGVNNVYKFDVATDLICDDISDEISWFNPKLKRQKRNIEFGYIYACSVPEFRKVIDNVPAIDIRRVLF